MAIDGNRLGVRPGLRQLTRPCINPPRLLSAKAFMCLKIGDWEIIQFIDYEDEDWSYEHIYKHADGREAVVGPGGYCSDPDLSWLLHGRERKKKQMARIKIATSICLNAAWLPVGIQGLQQFLVTGWIALTSLLGYAICCLGAFGSWYALISSDNDKKQKWQLIMLVTCSSLFVAGSGLIAIGGFAAISLGGVKVPLVLASAALGLAGSLSTRWHDKIIN